jgi:hypothetical protein
MKTTMLLLFLQVDVKPCFGFTAYDCTSPSHVRVYSLLGSAGCKTPIDDRHFTKEVYAEVVQQKESRRIVIYHCQLIQSVYSQHCGMFSHSGVLHWEKFNEQVEIPPASCREMVRTHTATLDGKIFNFTMGVKNTYKHFIKGTLDLNTRKCVGGEDDDLVYAAIYELLVGEEDATLYEDTAVMTIPTGGRLNIQVRYFTIFLLVFKK